MRGLQSCARQCRRHLHLRLCHQTVISSKQKLPHKKSRIWREIFVREIFAIAIRYRKIEPTSPRPTTLTCHSTCRSSCVLRQDKQPTNRQARRLGPLATSIDRGSGERHSSQRRRTTSRDPLKASLNRRLLKARMKCHVEISYICVNDY